MQETCWYHHSKQPDQSTSMQGLWRKTRDYIFVRNLLHKHVFNTAECLNGSKGAVIFCCNTMKEIRTGETLFQK